ncbi:MAG: hypothetical protein COB67_10080 [SAR324 cluster bacterium]|uniref:FlgO domain-containing protein n=1 Tax=SAR324 cluster bacterium TaxID=2024889 RepID=A0A2A4SZF1_9DELT|nr:MAG: hypothetical protein COB67_10080 [SAR324 cluster bacterium]
MRQRQRLTGFLLIFIAMLLLIGCGSTSPKLKEVRQYYPLDDGLKKLTQEIVEGLSTGIKSGGLPEILDIAVLDIEEKTTGQNLEFSSYLSSKLLNLTSTQVSKEVGSILFIEQQKIRNALADQPKDKKIDSSMLASLIQSNLLIKGSFFQENEESVILQIEIFNPKQGTVYKTLEIGLLVSSIPKQLTQSFPFFVNRAFDTLYQSLSEAKLENIPSLVNKNWNEYYTPNHRRTLRESITNSIFSDLEGLVVGDAMAKDRLSSVENIKLETKHLSLYLQGKFSIQVLDYNYHLTQEQKAKVKESMSYIRKIEAMLLRGVEITFAFIAKSNDNDPLDFECDGDMELKISIGKNNYYYDIASCVEEGERQVMTWLDPFKLKVRNVPIVVVEENILGDETIKAHLQVSPETLLNIYHQGSDEVSLSGSPQYLVRFRKYN